MTLSFSLSDRLALRLGALLALFAIILGALAAHGPVHDYLAARGTTDLWRTALVQQWAHALALLALGGSRTARHIPLRCWLAGVGCFSGSLYLLGLEPGWTWAGPITPLGGVFLISGWLILWYRLLPNRAERAADSASI